MSHTKISLKPDALDLFLTWFIFSLFGGCFAAWGWFFYALREHLF